MSIKYNIPNIVHFTFRNNNLPYSIRKIIQHNKSVCRFCEFRFYDDNACDAFIKKHFPVNVYNAYKSINDCYGAMKADFFRYCVLYIVGGIYIDIKSVIKVPLFTIIQPNDICLLDYPRNDAEYWRKNAPTYEQWLLIFAPKHPYLYHMIKLMTYYIHSRYVPRIPGTKPKILHITGPDAFTKAINKYINKKQIQLHRNIDYNEYFMLGHHINYTEMYSMNGMKHYSKLNEPFYK
jgi:mannosyltransferase OCH1-like enzyme